MFVYKTKYTTQLQENIWYLIFYFLMFFSCICEKKNKHIMPRLDTEIKLDFKDVLIRPKRSTIKSRADVDISRQFTFRHAKRVFPDDMVPVIAANMDTVGTFEMAIQLAKHKIITCIHKLYSLDEWSKFASENSEILPYVVATSGMNTEDEEKLGKVIEIAPQINAICLDVANGYSEHFIELVKRTRERFPEHIIMAGNVVHRS